jgi:hypothetical protein
MLRELQRDFYRRVVRAEDESLRVYADAYFWRLHDVLAEQHAALRRQLGADAFEAIVHGYLEAYPPTHHDIGRAGGRLPAYLATCAEGCEQPWLAELASLERLHLDLYVAEDARPASFAELAGVPPDALPTLRLGAVPAFALLACVHDVAALWAGSPAPAPRPVRLLVWRQQLEVFHREAQADEWALLEALARGATVAELGELAATAAGVDDAARALGAFLARWIEDEMITLAR